MGKFRKWIGLIHELGQLAAAEEFFYSRCHRSDVHQSLRRRDLNILNGHSLFYDTFHTGKADTELILQQFPYGPEPSVAQVVDIVDEADTIRKVENITDRCDYVIEDDVLGRKLIL